MLPEDEADSQLATGFHLEVDLIRQRQMQVLPFARGWRRVVESFKADHVNEMRRYPERRIILLIDFDGQQGRFEEVRQEVPDDLKDRVFILGVWGEPEDLIGSMEIIGGALAKDCREETDETWRHPLLRHNASELDRLREHVRPILFQP